MFDGWKLELYELFSIKENRLKTPKLGYFKYLVKKFRACLMFKHILRPGHSGFLHILSGGPKNLHLWRAKYLAKKILEIHPKYTSVYFSKAMFDGWKLELYKFFSIQENRLKTSKLGFFK